MVDWFERLMGFRETDYAGTRAKLTVEGTRLRSLVNGASYAIGELESISLQALRQRASKASLAGRIRVSVVTGDVRQMHGMRENAGALFQVASQFNFLEMVSPAVTPEQGVTRYQTDHTQGPACAIAAGAATIYRNYFVPVGGGYGQTTECQIDGLAEIGKSLSGALRMPLDSLWKMRNGYALCTRSGLAAISRYLAAIGENGVDALRAQLCVGLHRDVEVTEAGRNNRSIVSQIFCSALPVAYSPIPTAEWQRFACMILEAAYEATVWAAVWNAGRGSSNVVFLTLLGGGAFGNVEEWIYTALRRALTMVKDLALDVRLVSYGKPAAAMLRCAAEFG